MRASLRVLGPRVLVRPDIDSREPEATESGVVIAKSMAAAVTGMDPVVSYSRGTVISVGSPRHPFREEALDLACRIKKLSATSYDSSQTNYELLRDTAQLLGDLVWREPCVSIGDDVLFSYDSGQEIQIAHDTFIILKEDELLGVVDPIDRTITRRPKET